ncbi:hypothetical protein [Streptomyces showdoensis]|uniref:hypothetical protein n=1 Tax=Streptomyces showdoensis TaxID=68268 RepID=UPI000F4FBDE1
MSDTRGIDVFLGLDVGKGEHHATAMFVTTLLGSTARSKSGSTTYEVDLAPPCGCSAAGFWIPPGLKPRRRGLRASETLSP